MARTTLTASYQAASQAYGGGALTAQDRDALIEAHLPQVKLIADRLAAKLPPSVDRDDLIGAGVLGLLDAASKFDAARGVRFKTYAETRIRGAILDSLRDLDWAPRAMRQRARELEAAARRIEQEQGRMAEEEELAAALGLSMAEYQALLTDLRSLSVADLDDEDDTTPNALARQVLDDPERAPLAEYERTEVRDLLAAQIDRLPPRERQVIALYYVEELTMREVGAALKLTESRVSQIHTQAMIHLRAALAPLRATGGLTVR
jgi:RNA polymerase sigma factor FliA